MAKELYIYSGIYGFTAETVVKELNNISDNEELTIRYNTPGGSTDAGWSIISKLSERKTPIKGIVDGQASSMGAMMLPFMDNVIANDTSRIMFHKAAYPSWYEASEGEQQTLKTINDQFKSKLEAKVNGRPKGKDFIDKVFEADVRNDVVLTPQEAFDLGIVNEIRTLEPKAYAFDVDIVAFADDTEKQIPEMGSQNNHSKQKSMDLQELKTKHPELYAQVKAEGHEAGIKAEQDRVGAWLAFKDIDADAVAKGIKDGENLTQTAMAEFTAKGIAQARTQDHKDDNAGDTKPGADGKTADEIKAEAQEKEAAEALAKFDIK